MKKLLLMLVTFFFAVSLTGCFLEPDDIEEISEQYCRDNPEADICQGEAIDDLQDEAVINVFNTILDEYQDETNTTFCEDYFSVTNVEILDKCRESRDFLFPEEFDGYEIATIEKQDTLSTQTIYDITLTKDGNPTKYIFTISLVKVEGTMFIDDWSFESDTDPDVNPADEPITFDQAKAYFIKFIEDYQNSNISTDVYCTSYFPNNDNDQEECKKDRNEDIQNNIIVVLDQFYIEDGKYYGIIDITLDDEGNYKTTLLLEFSRDENGNIKMMFGDIPNEDQFYNIYDSFLNMFNTTTDPQTTCSQIMVPEQVDVCIQGWNEIVAEGASVTINSFELDTDGERYKVELMVTGNGQTDYVQMFIKFIQIDGEWRMEQHPVELPLTEQIKQLIHNLVADFNELTLTDIEVCNKYFHQEDVPGCLERRNEFRQNNESLRLGYLTVSEDMKFEVEFIFTINGVDKHEEIVGHVVYGQYGELLLKFEHGPDMQFEQFIRDLVADFNDQTLTDDEVCNYYFELEHANSCKERRNQARQNMENIELISFEFIDTEGFKVEFKWNGTNGEYTEIVWAHFYQNQNGEMKVEFNDKDNNCQMDFDTAQAFLDSFVAKFNNYNEDTTFLATLFMHPDTQYTFINWRNDAVANSKTISYYWLYEEYSKYSFEFEMTDGTRVKFNVEWICTSDGHIVNLWPYDDPSGYTYDDAISFLDDLKLDFNSGNYTSEEICARYFLDTTQVDCVALINGTAPFDVLSIHNVFVENGYFRAIMRYASNDGTSYTMGWIFHLTNQNGVMYGILIPLDDVITFDEMQATINNFVTDFNSINPNHDEVCNYHLTGDSLQTCIDLRNEVYSYAYIWPWGYHIEGDTPYMLDLGIYNNSDDIIDFIIHYQIEFMKDENGSIRMRLLEDFRYRHTTLALAESEVDLMLMDLNNFDISDDEFCGYWGHIFKDCYATRNRVASDNITALKTYFYGMEDTAEYELHISLTFDDGTVDEVLRFKLFIFEYLDGTVQFRGHQLEDNPPPQYDAHNLLDQFLQMYFNSDLSDQDIMDRLNDGFELHGLYNRAEILGGNYTYTIISVTNTDEYGYPVYTAVVEYTNNIVTPFQVTYTFDIYHNMAGEPVVNFVMPYETPTNDEMFLFGTTFVNNLNDMSIDDETFCTSFTADWDMWACKNLREQLRDSGYTAQLGDIVIIEFETVHFWIDIYNDGVFVSSLRLDVFHEYDIFINPYYKVIIAGGDQDVINAASTYIEAIKYAFNTHGLNLTTFCNEFANCHGAFDDFSQLHEVKYFDIYWDFEDMFDMKIRFDFRYEYMHGGMLYHNYYATYTINSDGEYEWMIHFAGEKMIIPTTANVLTLAESTTVMNQFILDVVDNSITNEILCDTYFGGFMMNYPECIEGRADMLASAATVTYTPLTAYIDEDGVTWYETIITVDYGTEQETHDAKILIHQVTGETTYYLEFK